MHCGEEKRNTNRGRGKVVHYLLHTLIKGQVLQLLCRGPGQHWLSVHTDAVNTSVTRSDAILSLYEAKNPPSPLPPKKKGGGGKKKAKTDVPYSNDLNTCIL